MERQTFVSLYYLFYSLPNSLRLLCLVLFVLGYGWKCLDFDIDIIHNTGIILLSIFLPDYIYMIQLDLGCLATNLSILSLSLFLNPYYPNRNTGQASCINLRSSLHPPHRLSPRQKCMRRSNITPFEFEQK